MICITEGRKTVNKSQKSKGVHDGHRIRVKEKFLKSGFENMHPHEVLEMLLFYSVPRRDTNELAHELINRFGSFPRVLEASAEELMKVKGITKNSAVLIKMILPLYNQYSSLTNNVKKLVRASESGRFLTEYYGGLTQERVTIICMDAKCGILGFEVVCDGDVSNVSLDFRGFIEIIMKYPAMAAAIVAHNHPLGLALPSREDIEATVAIKSMLNNFGIRLVDHIIVTIDDHVSMAASDGFRHLFDNN
jgi:DNA repair protein RadC